MNPIKEIFTGGACNPDEAQRARGAQNPFNNFLQNLVTGPAATRQRVEGFYPEEQMAQQIAMERAMNGTWDQLTLEMQQKLRLEEAAMQEAWQGERLRLQEVNRQRAIAQHAAWEAAVHQQQQAEIQGHADEWAAKFTEDYHQEVMDDAFKAAEDHVLSKAEEDEAIKNSASEMMSVMMNDSDPKFKNSQFLQFLSKLKTGEYKIEENELIVDPTKAVPLDTITAPREAPNLEEMAHQEGEETKEDMGQYQNLFDQAWKMALNGEEDKANEILKKLDEAYQKELREMEVAQKSGDKDAMMDHMNEAWQKAQDVEEQSLFRDIGPYAFSSQNPFAHEANPLAKALELIAHGRTCDAILALEAHLQREPNDAENWRVLGRLHQENDEDQRAVPCLIAANKIDPSHLDTHLALGVSCTNTLDEARAMNHLNKWMLFNPKFKLVGINPQIVPIHKLETNDSYSIEEINRYNEELINYFNKARSIDPTDPGLHSALAVLFFIKREYDKSVDCFKAALQHDPLNYSLWNKLGATLAHLGRTDEAMEAYHRALDLKPNYVRVWVNLGIAHAFKKNYEEAARFYLNALSFNPNAVHLWSYLNSAFVCMERFDLVSKIEHHDVGAFRGEFDVLKVDELPPPEVDYIKAHEHFVVQKEAQNWGNEFQESLNQ